MRTRTFTEVSIGILMLLFSNSFGQNNALDFDGINDYVVIPDDNSYDFNTNSDFTVEVWIKIPSLPQRDLDTGDNDIVEKWSQSGGYPFVIRYFNITKKIVAARWDGTISSSVETTSLLNDDQWHHIAFVKNGTTLLLYVDGVLENSAPDNSVASTTNNSGLFLGRRGGGFDNYWTGSMDELRIWNYARSITQINNTMKTTIATIIPGLVLNYNFNQGIANGDNSGFTVAIDKSPSRINGRLNGFALNGSTLEFDGLNRFVVIPDSNAIDFNTNDNFTVEAKLKIPSTPQVDLSFADNDIIEKLDQSSGSYPYVIRYINSGPLAGKITAARYADPNNPSVISTSLFNNNTWHHIAFVKDGSNLLLYVDGILEGSETDNTIGTTVNNSRLYLGRRGNGTNRWNGSMDDLRIWNIARSASQTSSNINTAFMGNESGLVLCYNFNQGTPGVSNVGEIFLKDIGPNGLNGTLVNFESIGFTSNWVSGLTSIYIPTMGQWGLIICGLFMLILGVSVLQSQKTKVVQNR